jgi:hypothetical protein
MAPEQCREEGHVIVAGIPQMGFALRTDRVGIRADQRVDGREALIWGLTGLPVIHDLPQQGDQRIGLLLVLAVVVLKGFLALVMKLLHAADKHLGHVIQGLSRPDADQGDGQRDPFGLLHGLHPRDVQGPGLVGEAL